MIYLSQILGGCMKALVSWPLTLLVVSTLSAQPGKDLTWAYPVPDWAPATNAAAAEQIRLAGSSKAYTQIDDQFNPPDWYPDDRAPLPSAVEKGIQAQACGSCLLMSSTEHPESATSSAGPQMKKVIEKLSEDHMISTAATASLNP